MLVNGILLYVNRSEVEKPKATVILTHGIAEHSGRYERLTKALNDAAYNVVRYDIRGHGQSQGKRGKLSSYKKVISDLHVLVETEKKLNDLPIYLFGHSMGGLIVNMYAVTHHDIDGIICSGAATYFVKDILPLRLFGYKWLGFLSKKTNFADNRLSRIKEVEQAYISDPLNLKKFYISLVGNMMVSGVRYLNKQIKNYQSKVLILHGEDDKIVPCDFSRRFYKIVPVEDKTLITYPKSYHEILNDLDQDKVRKDIINWLDLKVKGNQ